MFIIIQDTIINTDFIVTISKDYTGYNSTVGEKEYLYKYYIKVEINNKILKPYETERFLYESERDRDKAFIKIIKKMEIRG